MSSDSCGICGGDGRIGNSFGLTTKCPSCHGTGRRNSEESLFRDVTKTKQTWPASHAGAQLANEVQSCPSCSKDTMARLIREIIDHEIQHGTCTQTFVKKIRKQIRPLT